jgi:hypothetical protein
MVVVPPLTPVTTPVVLIVAIDGELLAHVPPDDPSVRVVVAPTQTDVAPEIAPGGVGALFTTNDNVAGVDPQKLVSVYEMRVEPVLTPVTTPDVLMVAIPGVTELQVPPAVASVSVIVEPTQTVPGPDIDAGADGTVVTVSLRVEAVEPHALVIV